MSNSSTSSSEDPAASPPGLSGPRALGRAARQFLRSQLWLLVALAVACVGLELGLRVMRPDLAGQVYGPIRTGGHPIVFSESSFRIPQDRGAGPSLPAILGLGDSTTFGTGVAAEETWPLRLATHLPDAGRVANAGFSGGGLRELSHVYSTLWVTPEQPQTVVLLVTGNMISFTEFRSDTPVRDPLRRVRSAARELAKDPGLKTRLNNLVQGSPLWKATANSVEVLKYALGLLDHRTNPRDPLSPLLAYGWQQPDLPSTHGSRMWATFADALAALNSATQRQKSCLVVGFLPPRFMLSDQLGDNLKFVPKPRLRMDAAAQVARIASDLDVPFVDMTPVLQTARANARPMASPLYMPNDYTHLNAQGHDLVAQAFAAFLETVSPCN